MAREDSLDFSNDRGSVDADHLIRLAQQRKNHDDLAGAESYLSRAVKISPQHERAQLEYKDILRRIRYLELQADKIRQAQICVVSYPKSGRTWIRYFLARYVESAFAIPFDLEFRIQGALPWAIFTHDYFDIFQDTEGEPHILFREQYSSKRMIILLRDPRDAAVSYYYQKKYRETAKSGRLDQFLFSKSYGIERQSDFVLKLIETFRQDPNVFFLTYENTLRDPSSYLLRVLEFIFGNAVNQDAFRAALAESSFSKMREYELTLNVGSKTAAPLGVPEGVADSRGLKVRKGEIEGFRKEMDGLTRLRLSRLPKTSRLVKEIAVLNSA